MGHTYERVDSMLNCASSWRLIAAFALVGTMCIAREARAVVILPLELVNNQPVPANGVLTFRYDPDMTVRVVASDGTEIPGRFVRDGIWRPEEPFEVGTYIADVSFEKLPDRAEDRAFEVIEALSLPQEFVGIRLTPRVDATEVLEQVCCKEGSALVFGQPCSTDCAPLCLPLAYAVEQKIEVEYGVDRDDPLVWQVDVRSPARTYSGVFPAGIWEVTGDPAELCGVAEVFSWLDETTTVVSHCIPNPKPDLKPVRETLRSFGYITECTIPPTEYEEEWCLYQAYTCEKEILTLPEPDGSRVTEACEHYYEVCERRFSAPPASSGAPTVEADQPKGAADSKESTARSGGGCSATGVAASWLTARHRWLMLVTLLALGLVRGRSRTVGRRRWTG